VVFYVPTQYNLVFTEISGYNFDSIFTVKNDSELTPLLFLAVTQRMSVLVYRRFGQPDIPIFKGQVAWKLKMGTTGCPKSRYTSTDIRCVTTQKTEDPI